MTYHRVCNYINTTDATRRAGTANLSRVHEFTFGFNCVRVTRSLVLCGWFVDRCLSWCTFSFGQCVVYSSSIYGLCVPFWYLQNILTIVVSYRSQIFIHVYSRWLLCKCIFNDKLTHYMQLTLSIPYTEHTILYNDNLEVYKEHVFIYKEHLLVNKERYFI
jgi:hypothetical protein